MIGAGVTALVALYCYINSTMAANENKKDSWRSCVMGWSVATGVLAALTLFVSSVLWMEQVSDFEDLEKFDTNEQIYTAKADALTIVFAGYLAEAYPQHEKAIFDGISPDKVAWYFARYPNLKAADTLTTLVERIGDLQSDVYDQQLQKAQALKNMRFRLRNPWGLSFMIPTE